jgi:hypothetical protein
MAVLSYREVLPRTLSHRFGEAPTAERKFVATLDGATATQTIINDIGIFHGGAHPEFSYLLCLNVAVSETDAFHAEVTYSYESPQEGTPSFQSSPMSRPDIWSFSTSGISVPSFRYYNGTGNSDIKPLINSAGDILEGAQAIEGELKLSIAGNRAAFPIASAVAVTGAVNADSVLGAAAYQWMCHGISGQPATEVVNGVEVNFWQVTAELSYKASGYQLYLPNVGWNYISGSGSDKKKERCYVFEGTDKIASASVMALNDDGSIRFNTDFTGSGAPGIFSRRVNPAVAFSTYFGTPPF